MSDIVNTPDGGGTMVVTRTDGTVWHYEIPPGDYVGLDGPVINGKAGEPLVMVDLDGNEHVIFPIQQPKETAMQQDFQFCENVSDADGNPAGGSVSSVGMSIVWQDGPLGRGDDRLEPNGAFVQTVIAAAKQRIEYYQGAADGRFACDENAAAIEYLGNALAELNARTAAREARSVEGTHEA